MIKFMDRDIFRKNMIYMYMIMCMPMLMGMCMGIFMLMSMPMYMCMRMYCSHYKNKESANVSNELICPYLA